MNLVACTTIAFANDMEGGSRFAEALGLTCKPIAARLFPDGESLITVPQVGSCALLYRPLYDPNPKLLDTLLAASALRDGGATRIVLVAPYLPYMRQDKAFAAGQAVSQKVIGRLLGKAFDAIIGVAPHLHRSHDLSAIFDGRPAIAIDPVIGFAALLKGHVPAETTIVVGPDQESEPQARSLAEALNVPFVAATKSRLGDTEVDLRLPAAVDLGGRHVVLVDDVVSTGRTLAAAARAARTRGARHVEAIVCHALFSGATLGDLVAAGVERVRSADGIPHPTNAVNLAPLLADAVRGL
jgi:ribose-phosphate pyrophosphokinase